MDTGRGQGQDKKPKLFHYTHVARYNLVLPRYPPSMVLAIIAVCGLLIAVTSLVEHRVSGTRASVAVAQDSGSCASQALEHGLSRCGSWA